jgi:hypothetical protein
MVQWAVRSSYTALWCIGNSSLDRDWRDKARN